MEATLNAESSLKAFLLSNNIMVLKILKKGELIISFSLTCRAGECLLKFFSRFLMNQHLHEWRSSLFTNIVL